MPGENFIKNGTCMKCGSPVDKHQSKSGETIFYCSNKNCIHSKEIKEHGEHLVGCILLIAFACLVIYYILADVLGVF